MYSYFSIPLSSNTLSGTECIASFIVGFFLLLITISWLSYTLSIITVGETLTLSIYKKRDDNVNILERKDEEILEYQSSNDEDKIFD